MAGQSASGNYIAQAADGSFAIVRITGLTVEEMLPLIEGVAASAAGPLADRIIGLSQRLGVAQGAMRSMLATIGHANVPDEELLEKLAEVVEYHREAAATMAALQRDNPVIKKHVGKAAEASAAGDRETARLHLQAARTAAEVAAEEARRLAREADGVAAGQMLQAARALAAEAELVLTALDYLEAARLFEEAASRVPDGAPQEKGILIRRCADALLGGGFSGDNSAWRRAIDLYGCALKLLAREREPFVWARTQNNFGVALVKFGEQESEMSCLEKAVTAFRSAGAALPTAAGSVELLERLFVQVNIKAVLEKLGAHESGPSDLQKVWYFHRT